MNIWHHIAKDRVTPERFFACIEISRGSHNKYELDKQTGMLKLDRVLYTSMSYPANYGFIPLTYAEDDDPLDVLVLCEDSIRPMTLVECRPIGVVRMLDGPEGNQKKDDKIICVPLGDPSFSEYNDINELPRHTAEKIHHFFEFYKTLETDKKTTVGDPLGREDAVAIVADAIDRYQGYFGGKV